MNDTIDDTIDDTNERAALKTAIDARTRARERLESAAAAVARAEQVASAAAARVAALEQAAADTETRETQELEAAIRAGGALPTLAAKLDAGSLAGPRMHASITTKALVSLKTAHTDVEHAAQGAELAVNAAVNALLGVQAEQIARQINELEGEVLTLRASLLGLQELAPKAISSGSSQTLHPNAWNNLVPTAHKYDPYLSWQHGPNRAMIDAGKLEWQQRIESLRAGDTPCAALSTGVESKPDQHHQQRELQS